MRPHLKAQAAFEKTNAAFNKANTGTNQLINGASTVSLSANGNLTVPGPIIGLGNAKLDFTTYGSNSAYLTTTNDDSTALFMGSATAELYAHTNILIRANTGGISQNWTFDEDGTLTFPDSTVQTTAATNIDALARSQVNSAFTQANSSNVLAQAAFTQANSSNVLAQAAFNQANTASSNTIYIQGADQPNFEEISKAAKKLKIQAHYLPVIAGKISDNDVAAYAQIFAEAEKPVLGYCRSGMRAASLWALSQASSVGLPAALSAGKNAGYDLSALSERIAGANSNSSGLIHHEVVIVGGGAAGVAVASSLLSRNSKLDVAIIDPADTHYYQPGWTMVGGGIFKPSTTVKTMASVIPSKAKWIKAAVAGFEPEAKQVILEGCRPISYDALIVCPGIKLNWPGIEGLVETLGQNGVTSNYRYDLAPYTWELVKQFKKGKAIFTQPPMPIKCAGAPQKAMYLSADHWLKSGRLNDIQIDFYNAGPVLFGVKE